MKTDLQVIVFIPTDNAVAYTTLLLHFDGSAKAIANYEKEPVKPVEQTDLITALFPKAEQDELAMRSTTN